MTYDLTAVKAPRVAGTMLRVVARLAESSITGPLLSRKLLSDLGIPKLRATLATEPLPVGPPGLARGARVESAAPPGTAPLEAAAALGGPTQGDFPFETAADFVAAYRDGRTDPMQVAERVLAATAATEALSPPLRVFIAQDAADVRAQAAAAAERYRRGAPLGPLDGVPIAVKDEIDQRAYPTTVGTSFLGKTPAGADAEVIARLRRAGAILIGKTNMHEMGLGVTGINPHHGAARNPYDPSRVTGGSSSGPAAAVAAGLCPIAIGADGGGSIRLPAALCGVVGLKATFGRVSEVGAAPLCWSVAHVGPLAASVRDIALAYAAIAGIDPGDPNTALQPPLTLDGVGAGDLAGLKLGVYRPWWEHASEPMKARCADLLDGLKGAGAEVVEIEIPELDLLRIVHLVTIVSEMTAAHQPYDPQHRRDYAPDTRLNLSIARRLTARDYAHAQRHRVRLSGHFEKALLACDAIVTPATGRTAPPIAADALSNGEADLTTATELMRFMPAANLTGHPAISLPAGYDGDGLPVGFQAIGRAWEEHVLLRIAHVAERLVARARPRVHHTLLAAEATAQASQPSTTAA